MLVMLFAASLTSDEEFKQTFFFKGKTRRGYSHPWRVCLKGCSDWVERVFSKSSRADS